MSTSHYKILLVDDDAFISDLYAMKFNKIGHELTVAYSVDDALTILKKKHTFDAIATDLIMPGQDGFDLLREVREQDLAGDAVLIALTNQDSDEVRTEFTNLGVHQHIVKAHALPNEVVAMILATITSHK